MWYLGLCNSDACIICYMDQRLKSLKGQAILDILYWAWVLRNDKKDGVDGPKYKKKKKGICDCSRVQSEAFQSCAMFWDTISLSGRLKGDYCLSCFVLCVGKTNLTMYSFP